MCFHNALLVYEGAGEPSRLSYGPDQMRPFYDITDLLRENFIQTASIFYRRSALAEPPPPWWYRMPVGDWPLLVLVAQNGLVGYLPDTMSVYRLHEGGVWGLKGRRRQLEQTAAALELFLTEFASKLPDAANASAIVHRSAFDTYRELGDWRNAMRHARKVPGYVVGSYLRDRESLFDNDCSNALAGAVECGAQAEGAAGVMANMLRKCGGSGHKPDGMPGDTTCPDTTPRRSAEIACQPRSPSVSPA